MYNHKTKTSFVRPCLGHLGSNKTGFNLMIVNCFVLLKLFILRLFQVVLAVEDKLIHWDLAVPKQIKVLNLGSVITKLQSDGDVIHCATVGET